MASPFRTSSPSSANRPSKANTNNSLRKSFNVNVLPKATASRNGSQAPYFTPVNSPADYPIRTSSPFKDFNTPGWQSEEIGLENVRHCPPKSASAKSPAPKGMKNFMSPTFSAASKAASPKKRVLVERNESVRLSQTPAKVPSDFANTHFMNLPASREPMSEGTYMKENEEAPRDIMEVDFVRSVAQPEIQTKKEVCRVLYQIPPSSKDNDSLSFLSQFPDPGEERTTAVLPPYDPKRNYLSPRPDFLRYRPDRSLDIEDEEGFGKRGLFKSETSSESGVTETKKIERMDVVGISSAIAVTETKEIESLGQRMDAVAISSEALDHGRTHKESKVIMASDVNSEPNKLETPPESGVTENKEYEFLAEEMDTVGTSSEALDHGETLEGLQVKQVSAGNPEQSHGLEYDSKRNAQVELEETADESDEEDREEHKQNFQWLRTSLLFGFVLLVASVALLSSGSPGLLPPSLHDNVLARGEFYESTVDIAKNVVVIWRRDSVKNACYSLLGYSRTKYGIIEKSVKSWFDSSSKGMRTQSSMKDGLQNSIVNNCTGNIEETGKSLDIWTNVENDIKSVTILSELDLKEKQSSNEADLEALDAILDKDVSQIPSIDSSVQQNGQVNIDGDVLHKIPEQPFPSELLDTDSNVEAHESKDFVASSPSVDASVDQNGLEDIDDDVLHDNPELLFPFDLVDEEYSVEGYESEDYERHPEALFSFYPTIEEATTTGWTTEDSWSEIQFEEAQDDAEEQIVPEVPETIQVSDAAEILSSIIDQDAQISGEDALNEQSKPSMVPSDDYQSTDASQLEKTDKLFAEDIESTISNEPKESPISAGENSEGSEVQTSAIPRRNQRGLLPIGTTTALLILVASIIAAICSVYASKKRVKISHEVVADKPPVEFFAKKESQKENRPPLERMERTFSPMHFSSSRNYPQVQFLAEYHPEEVSSSDKNVGRINAQEKSVQMYERRFRKGNMFSSDTQQDSAVTSELSPDSLSYGSFTTYEKIARKEGGGDKDTKVVTPVRRSNRIRKQATSP